MKVSLRIVQGMVASLVMQAIALPAGAVLKPEPFNPIMASFSNELEFDALRGRVKSFEQALYDNSDTPVMYAKGEFDRQGCLMSYEKIDGVNNGKIKLTRNTADNTLISAYDPQRVIHLNDRCEVTSTDDDAGTVKDYIYDQHGFLVKVKGHKDAWVYKEYFYTPEGMPKSVVYYGDEKDFLIITEPKKTLNERWDFITEGLNDGKPVFQSVKKCVYDERYNPTVCYLITAELDNGIQTKRVEQIHYIVKYY
ncbi:YnfC family lipoprotein [Shimwellia pseudoproteus]|uniref:YnfC family lipoprotein n=1 Tax=Shimwellia pseudoproteus TaxID=570012 RepID=UPI0018EAC8F0|nr:YnfC family lipoprotein [Shimwellia pseudoproteus]MBJ3815689.1 YnfC family lipoprotein [Shimwellia pseudoproteus]